MTVAACALGPRFTMLVIVTVVFSALAGSKRLAMGETPVPRERSISEAFFGMTINHPLTTPWPPFMVKTLRAWDMSISWSDINSSPATFHWDKFDAIVELAHRQRVELIYTFGRTPRWASAKPDAGTNYGPGECGEPDRPEYWEEFVRAVVARAAGRVRYWEIWNEPQEEKSYCGSMAEIVRMQHSAYALIKASDPSLQVLTPSPVGGYGPQWMDLFLSAGGGEFADIMAFHGYWDDDPRSVVEVTRRYKRIIEKHGQAGKPLWNTEGGWGQQLDAADFNAEDRMAFIAKYFLLQWSEGVDRSYWYSYDNELGWGTLWDKKNSLLPAGRAYAEVLAWMVGATMTNPCQSRDATTGLWTCTLSRSPGYQAIVAWRSGKPLPFAVPTGYTRVRDLYGTEKFIGKSSVELGAMPVLFEMAPMR